MLNDRSLFLGDRRQGDTRAVTDCTTAFQPEMMQLNGRNSRWSKKENGTPLEENPPIVSLVALAAL